MNTYIYIRQESHGKDYSLGYRFWHEEQKMWYQAKKTFHDDLKNLKYHVFAMINESLEQAKKEGITCAVLVMNRTTGKAFLTNISKKGLKNLVPSLIEEATKLIHYKKEFAFLGYRYEKVNQKNEEKQEKTPVTKQEIFLNTRSINPNFYEYISYTDVSVREHKAAIAGMIYDKQGTTIYQFKKEASEKKNTTFLEAKAIYENMKKAEELGLQSVLFQTDALNVLSTLEYIITKEMKNIVSPRFQRKEYKLIKLIQLYLIKYPNWNLKRIKRNQNKQAHQLVSK